MKTVNRFAKRTALLARTLHLIKHRVLNVLQGSIKIRTPNLVVKVAVLECTIIRLDEPNVPSAARASTTTKLNRLLVQRVHQAHTTTKKGMISVKTIANQVTSFIHLNHYALNVKKDSIKINLPSPVVKYVQQASLLRLVLFLAVGVILASTKIKTLQRRTIIARHV